MEGNRTSVIESSDGDIKKLMAISAVVRIVSHTAMRHDKKMACWSEEMLHFVLS